MKKFAIAIAALSLSAGAAFAENPYVGRTDVIQSGPNAGKPIYDQGTTASIGTSRAAVRGDVHYADPVTGIQNGVSVGVRRVYSGQ
ncbi:MAG: hypothetical protein QHC90_11790 [Shinella sp.]|nr:hypothetical protein [Shinella sp.]